MTKNSPKGSPEEVDPLSATAMFLRTFDQKADAEPKSSERPAPETGRRADAASPAGRIERVSPAPPPAALATESTGGDSPSPSTDAPGEFTRIFVRGAAGSPAANPPPRSDEEGSQSTPTAKPSRMQGFSTPGASDAAAADHDFTQFFKAAPRPSAPAPGSSAAQPAFAPKAISEPSRKDAFIGYGPEQPPAVGDAPPSVTSLIASLSSSQELPAASGENQAAAPYRPEPLPSYQPPYQPPTQSAESSAPDSGGVTRLLQRLSEPAPKPAPAERPEPVPASSLRAEPGEFTRMISRAEASPAISPAAAAPGPRPVEPLAAAPRSVPAIPPVPIASPPGAAPAPPVFSAPKPPAPTAPSVAASKSKLDAMVPILLVINTFLLLVLLIAVLFLIKSR